MVLDRVKITPVEFSKLRELIHSHTGITLSDKKINLVENRLSKRLKALKLENFTDYYNFINRDERELLHLTDAISTNVTSFFRESSQWEFLKQNIEFFNNKRDKRLRIWSSACSAGQEPYSIIMFLKENLRDFNSWDIKILATDISLEILQRAQKGLYSDKELETLPQALQKRYIRDNKIDKELQKYITFRSFNLVNGNFNMFRNHFDIIFCRNVMIYFDSMTQQRLVSNFKTLMYSGALLFIGHSESLNRNLHEFELVKSSIYRAK